MRRGVGECCGFFCHLGAAQRGFRKSVAVAGGVGSVVLVVVVGVLIGPGLRRSESRVWRTYEVWVGRLGAKVRWWLVF